MPAPVQAAIRIDGATEDYRQWFSLVRVPCACRHACRAACMLARVLAPPARGCGAVHVRSRFGNDAAAVPFWYCNVCANAAMLSV